MPGRASIKAPGFQPYYLQEFGPPPPGSSIATHYAHADRRTQAWLRQHLRPKSSLEDFRRWIVEAEPWQFFAREDQREPPGDWMTWLYQAGRGAGKTRSGSEWAFSQALAGTNSDWQIGVLSPTFDDLTRVTFGGPSGLMRLVERNRHLIKRVVTKPWTIEFKHGPKILSYTGEAIERLRGPNHAAFWWDEVAGMARVAEEAYDQIMFGLRIGRRARMLITSTPKPIPLFKSINEARAAGDQSVVITRATMMDNAANLSRAAVKKLQENYEGTRLGEQELYGKLLLDVPGALWLHQYFQRVTKPHRFDRIVVAVDPSGAQNANSKSDEIGIVVAGVVYGTSREFDKYYLLEDATMIGSPGQWASRAVKAFDNWDADLLVAEANFGGGMVLSTIKQADPNVPVKLVTASRGKQVRAEPVASIYEQGRGYVVAGEHDFTKLIDQACSMTTAGYVGSGSPDRVDAAVWAISELMAGARAITVIPTSINSVSYWRSGNA